MALEVPPHEATQIAEWLIRIGSPERAQHWMAHHPDDPKEQNSR
jgi:hypothetical protein